MLTCSDWHRDEARQSHKEMKEQLDTLRDLLNPAQRSKLGGLLGSSSLADTSPRRGILKSQNEKVRLGPIKLSRTLPHPMHSSSRIVG